jgi:flavin reductase (DIM6/NTAB) family NADH-FMN oxidoreductase RutF
MVSRAASGETLMPHNDPVRLALRTFQYGLYILTCGHGQDAHAATISWVTQISLKPRRLAIGVRKDSHIYPVLQAAGQFALNVVGEGQEALASVFFRYAPPGDHTFDGYAFEDGPMTGAPLLLASPAWLECRIVEEANAGGDHGLFVAEVLAGDLRHAGLRALNLATTNWSYGG